MAELCIIFMTGYFGYNDDYHPIPKETTRIEIKTKIQNIII